MPESPDPEFESRRTLTESWLESHVNGFFPHAEADFVFSISSAEDRPVLVRVIISRVNPVVSFGVVLVDRVDQQDRSALVEICNIFNEAIAWGKTWVSFVSDRVEFSVDVSLSPTFEVEHIDQAFRNAIGQTESIVDRLSPYLHQMLHNGKRWHEVGLKFLQDVGIVQPD